MFVELMTFVMVIIRYFGFQNLSFGNLKTKKMKSWILKFESEHFVKFTLYYGLLCCFPNRGDEVNMCHFKEIHLLVEKYIWAHRGS